MATLTEGSYPGDIFLYEEDEHQLSRENITVLAGSGSAHALTRGMVLAKVSALSATVTPKTGNTGTGALTMDSTTPLLAGVQVGRYTVVCTAASLNAGTMTVYDPQGRFLGTHTVAGSAFATEIKFTVADATDFVVGDTIYVDIAGAAAKYVQLDVTASSTLAKVAAGILVDDVTAPDGSDAKGVAIVRHAAVAANKLVWPAGISATAKANAIAQLAGKGILVRDAA